MTHLFVLHLRFMYTLFKRNCKTIEHHEIATLIAENFEKTHRA